MRSDPLFGLCFGLHCALQLGQVECLGQFAESRAGWNTEGHEVVAVEQGCRAQRRVSQSINSALERGQGMERLLIGQLNGCLE